MLHAANNLAVRWTIGAVSAYGFEALRLSIWGARRLFGPDARYIVCVNSMSAAEARARTGGTVPSEVLWRRVRRREIPRFLAERLDGSMSEGVAWKFAPLRVFPDRRELALDNDCILWQTPRAIRDWLQSRDPKACVIAEDVQRCFGHFDAQCGPAPRNSGIRGLPAGFAYGAKLKALLAENSAPLRSELDEQGLQVAAVERGGRPLVVGLEEVSVCSPFPPHLQGLGTCGAHFVGVNAHRLPWDFDGRPSVAYIREHWERYRPVLYERVGIAFDRSIIRG